LTGRGERPSGDEHERCRARRIPKDRSELLGAGVVAAAVCERPRELRQVGQAGGELNLPALVDALLPRAHGRLYEEVLAGVERLLFERVLRHTAGHQTQASELLGINRATLRHKLRVLGLTVGRPGIRDVNGGGEGEERGTK
jgi:DNA-binding NtrC family response regulator